jgi:signal transduction histidine kinase
MLSPEPLEFAIERLRQDGEASLVDWFDPSRVPVYGFARVCGSRAHQIASLTSCCDPDRAHLTALLAPLGWLAAAAHTPTEVPATLADPAWDELPAETEHRRWGLDQSEIARRLSRHWSLPEWIASILGHLGLPPDVATQLGADSAVFSVVQLAVLLVQQQGNGLRLPIGGRIDELLHTVGLTSTALCQLNHADAESPPLGLTEFLSNEAARRRLQAQSATQRLEQELDLLHRTLEQQRAREADRLRTQKLTALAEFAGGAGHEINNPLAVISGQAQYLLGYETDAQRRKSLETIVGQTQRIHSLLRDLMQFARPPAPVERSTDLVALIDEVATSLGDLSLRNKVRVLVREGEAHPPVAPIPCTLSFDAGQVRTALTCLMKNAIEAAGSEGWVRVRLDCKRDSIEVLIEDSGPGLTEAQREHLFDPFYSGRQAGRGRGLGLPTAWALARQQGGEVLLASQPGETTRFLLRLPISAADRSAQAG